MKLRELIRRDGSKALRDELKLKKRKSNPTRPDGHPSDQIKGDGEGDLSDQAFDWGPEVPA